MSANLVFHSKMSEFLSKCIVLIAIARAWKMENGDARQIYARDKMTVLAGDVERCWS